MLFAKKTIDDKLPGLYYFIYWKNETHVEDIWELVKEISYLRQLLKKYHTKNPDKPTATSPPIDKSALSPPIVACLRAKIAFFILMLIHSPIRKYFHTHKNTYIQLCYSKQH